MRLQQCASITLGSILGQIFYLELWKFCTRSPKVSDFSEERILKTSQATKQNKATCSWNTPNSVLLALVFLLSDVGVFITYFRPGPCCIPVLVLAWCLKILHSFYLDLYLCPYIVNGAQLVTGCAASHHFVFCSSRQTRPQAGYQKLNEKIDPAGWN